ncbi:Hypothetical protein R9X50_00686100 [Acrodontium crateriforme]|uniref:Fatty acid hydroxylase domain-containing protein n=1 Tax=Acrodontium crateriforme TaxID=150365 RepID=A0AAQ3MAV3_9PEZI|nr:Hypothetical protein R9X50_00686100 [Acrodontium crateriforme]
MSTTTETMTASSGKPAVATPIHKDSMKSTWRTDKSQWRTAHHILNWFNAWETELDVPVPVHAKTDKVPYLTEGSVHAYILSHALWPMALQYAFVKLTGWYLHPVAAYLLYGLAYKVNAIHAIRIMRRLTHRFGFLDGNQYKRDSVPDQSVSKVLWSVELTTSVRMFLAVFLAYKRELPHFSWWLPVELALYSVVLDFFFYTYHRCCHEIPQLWQYHRTHHLTKHPVPLLSSYADAEQEFIEIALIPLLTYLTLKSFGLPMNFYDWFLCQEYIIFSETFGHSGLRVYYTVACIASPLLRLLNMDLVTEDHDLHHRKGWKKAHNYGKQTRVWDRIFGSCTDRIEFDDKNVDFGERIDFPLW